MINTDPPEPQLQTAQDYDWLNRSLAVGSALRTPDAVGYRVT